MKIAVAGATGRVGRHVVEILESQGHEVVRIARSNGVDVATGEGLGRALAGVEAVVDTTSTPTPDERAATDFFLAASHNLQRAGASAGVRRIVVISIIGIERFPSGYLKAKVAHEKAALAGPVPARILRAAQFHEFVEPLVDWGKQKSVSRVPRMRTQLVAAGPSRRRSRTSRRIPAPRPRRPARRRSRLPVRDPRSSSTPRGGSSLGGETASASRPATARPTRTRTACTSPGRCFPDRTRRSPVRPSTSGWTRPTRGIGGRTPGRAGGTR